MDNSIPGIGTYFGGKGGSGTYQAIINKIPPHTEYIEPFLGAGAIMKYKKPAQKNLGLDLDQNIVQAWNQYITRRGLKNYQVVRWDAIEYLSKFKETPLPGGKDIFIYCDPPYLHETRSDPRSRYMYELTKGDHINLLKVITSIKDVMIAISCYENDLYTEHLKDWNCHRFNGTTRGGSRKELLYMNYPEPTELHDYRFLGTDFIDRGRIKKKINRYVNRLKQLPVLEQKAILTALKDSFDL